MRNVGDEFGILDCRNGLLTAAGIRNKSVIPVEERYERCAEFRTRVPHPKGSHRLESPAPFRGIPLNQLPR
jgi:hypothetical protein